MSLNPNPRLARDIPTGVADAHPSAAAGGLRVFAGVIMLVSGLFQFLQGVSALADGAFFAATNSTYDGDITVWGWIHIVAGGLVALIGLGVLRNSLLARGLAIPLVMVSMFANFAFLPHYPLWGIIIIVFDVFIVWAIVAAPEY